MLFLSIIMFGVATLRVGIDAWQYFEAKQVDSFDDVTFNNRGIGGIFVSLLLTALFSFLNWWENRRDSGNHPQ